MSSQLWRHMHGSDRLLIFNDRPLSNVELDIIFLTGEGGGEAVSKTTFFSHINELKNVQCASIVQAISFA